MRAPISTFVELADPSPGPKRMARDQNSGAWQERSGVLLEPDALDLGYGLVVAGGTEL